MANPLPLRLYSENLPAGAGPALHPAESPGRPDAAGASALPGKSGYWGSISNLFHNNVFAAEDFFEPAAAVRALPRVFHHAIDLSAALQRELPGIIFKCSLESVITGYCSAT